MNGVLYTVHSKTDINRVSRDDEAEGLDVLQRALKGLAKSADFTMRIDGSASRSLVDRAFEENVFGRLGRRPTRALNEVQG